MLYLRIKDMKKFIKMCCCGLGGLIIQMIVFNFLRKSIPSLDANIIAIELAIIVNFISNNYFSFSTTQLRKKHGLTVWGRRFGYFLLISHGSLLLQISVLFLGNHFWRSSFAADNIWVLSGILIGSILNYFCYKQIVWKPVLAKNFRESNSIPINQRVESL